MTNYSIQTLDPQGIRLQSFHQCWLSDTKAHRAVLRKCEFSHEKMKTLTKACGGVMSLLYTASGIMFPGKVEISWRATFCID